MPVFPDPKEDQIEHGETDGILGREFGDELGFVFVCEGLEVVFGGGGEVDGGVVKVRVGGLDGVDLGGWDGDAFFGVEGGLAEVVVGVRVVEGDYAFVSIEYVPI